MTNILTLCVNLLGLLTETATKVINILFDELRDVLLEYADIWVPNASSGLLDWVLDQSIIELSLGSGLLFVLLYLTIKAFIPVT